jgi:hypothetical protein
MTAVQPPPAAVQIACDAVDAEGEGSPYIALNTVRALAERYAFVDHAEYAALKAVAQAVGSPG